VPSSYHHLARVLPEALEGVLDALDGGRYDGKPVAPAALEDQVQRVVMVVDLIDLRRQHVLARRSRGPI
jgi:hypothetical protein